MKYLYLILVVLQAFCVALKAAPTLKISDFELSDQAFKTRNYHFPKNKITVMTVADHKGSAQLADWIEQIYKRYGTTIDIDGLADVSMIAKPFHGMFRTAFRKLLKYSVMLDWEGTVIQQFAYEKSVANVYLINKQGHIIERMAGPYSPGAANGLFKKIDRELALSSSR